MSNLSDGIATGEVISVSLADSTGTPTTVKAVNVQVVGTDTGPVTNSVIHGLTTGGGGGYVDVKVNPSGALTVDATQSGTWNVGVTGSVAVTGPLTDTELRATPVPISGTVTANLGTIAGVATETTLSALNTKVTTTANGIKVDGSAVTQPISAATLPLPTGAATSANQTTANASLASIDAGIPAALGQTTMANSMPVNIASDQSAIATAISMGDSIPVPSGYQPIRDAYVEGKLTVDYYGNLNTRSQVLTDEGSFRDNFIGTSLTTALTGTLNWTAGSDIVTGTGTLFLSEISTDYFIKKTADADTLFVGVLQVLSNTQLKLSAPYGGTTATGVASVWSRWMRTLGTGTIAVASSICSINSGNTNNNFTYIEKSGDYGPMTSIWLASVSARQANQNVFIGFRDNATAPNIRAEFNFNGTVNTVVQCITSASSAAADTETTTITIPNGALSSAALKYTVDIADERVSYLINDEVVASHQIHIPGPYDYMDLVAGISNSAGGGGGTTLALNFAQYKNYDRVNVGSESPNAPLVTQIVGQSLSSKTKLQRIDDGGDALVSLYDTKKATYSASITGLVVATAATDIFTLTGSATKTIRVTKILISATQTTAASNNIVILKRSTANTAGTSTAPAKIAHDSTSAAATGTVLAYTANPTLGTLVGNIAVQKLFIPSGTSTTAAGVWMQYYGDTEQAIVLRGTGEVLAINLSGVTFAGSSFNIAITWSEE